MDGTCMLNYELDLAQFTGWDLAQQNDGIS